MPLGNVEALHRELQLSEADTTALKAVKRIWARLTTLRQQAEKDVAHLEPYRDLLQKSLTQVRAKQPAPDRTVINKELWDWYWQEAERLEVPRREEGRGSDHWTWSQKWLPKEYTAFAKAVEVFADVASQHNMNEVKIAATQLLKAYVAAIPDR